METTKMSNFTCQLKSFISIFFTCQVSAYELQPFSCYELANDIYLQTAKTVFSHLTWLTELPLSLFSIEFIFFCSFTTFYKGSLIAANRSQWLKHIPSSKYVHRYVSLGFLLIIKRKPRETYLCTYHVIAKVRNDSNNIITLLGSQCKTLLPPCNNDKESKQLQQVICKTSKDIEIMINLQQFCLGSLDIPCC